MEYQYVIIPTGFTADTWVEQVQAAPTDYSVVHHIVAYVRTMRPPPATEAETDPIVSRGHEIFTSADAQCSSCHGDDGRAPDGARHDVRSRSAGDTRAAFDTPSRSTCRK
jgi:mono/diheme cytochrome c family protein